MKVYCLLVPADLSKILTQSIYTVQIKRSIPLLCIKSIWKIMVYFLHLFNTGQSASWGVAAAGLHFYQCKHSSRAADLQGEADFLTQPFPGAFSVYDDWTFSQPCDPTTTKASVREITQDLAVNLYTSRDEEKQLCEQHQLRFLETINTVYDTN